VMTLALNPVMTNLVVVFFLVVCVAMILIVLIQRPQGGGLSGAFGAGGAGQGAGQTAFGTKTGDVLTWGTVSVFVIYVLVAIGLNYAARPDTSSATAAPTLVDPATQDEPPAPEELPELPGAEGSAPADTGTLPPEENPADSPADPAGDPEPGDPEPGEPETDPASAEAPV
jgi:preprotein translocase subunit SecG